MTPRVQIIADDLTGALDVAGPFAARGHSTFVVVKDEGCAPDQFAGAAVLSINSASRHLAAAAAAARVRSIGERLCTPAGEICIKKIDSTVRGSVAAETLAIMHALGRANAIVVPAFPAQGRTMLGGMVHVDGVPLPQTGFARDALSPPPLVPLDQVFRSAAHHAQVERVAPDGPFELARPGEAMRVFVVDSATQVDLVRTVQALNGRLGHCVLVGSAGIAGALAATCLPQAASPERPRAAGQILVTVGSRAEQSVRQVAALAAQPGVELIAAPNGEVEGDALLRCSADTLILRATAAANGSAGDAERVATMLASSAVRVLRGRPVEALVATGGDTAVAILEGLGRRALQVVGDLLPGIPYCRLDVDGRRLWLVTKAGGFGTSDTLIEIVARLRGRS
jgi:D-threonate/D-erythronate kinase